MAAIVEAEVAPAITASSPTGVRTALLAPWWACAGPGRAARRLTKASIVALLLTFSVQTLCLGVVIVALMMFEAVLVVEPASPTRAVATSLPTTTFTRYVVDQPGLRVSWRAIDAVWREWHPAGHIGRPVFVLLLTGCLAPPLALLGTGLHLCTVHRRGPLTPSIRHAFAAIIAASGPLIMLVALAGAAAVFAGELVTPIHQGALASPVPGEFIVMTTIMSGLMVLLGATGRAAAAAEVGVEETPLPPRCEQCGYDLTETPREGRCPECGLGARQSLEGVVYRRGAAWEGQRRVGTWLETLRSVLFQPRAFYQALRLRGEDGSVAFRRIMFAILPPAVLVWFPATVWLANDWDNEAPGIAVAMGLMVGLLSWLVYRVAAGVAMIPWMLGDGLVDFRWARRVMGYESAFLLAFCAFNGAFVSMMLFFDDLAMWLVNTRGFFAIPLGPALVLFGNLGLGLVWIWRYQIALRAVRWSNY